MKKSKKGFTLVELIVVLAILAVVAAIAVPTAFGSIEKARQSADMSSVDSFNSAINMQAALISNVADRDTVKDSAGNFLNTFKAAVKAAGIKTASSPQSSSGIWVKWNAPTGTQSGYFDYKMETAAGYTQVAKHATENFETQLQKIIDAADATTNTGSKIVL